MRHNLVGARGLFPRATSLRHVAYGSGTTLLRAVIGVSSVLYVLLFASLVPYTYLC